MGVPIKVCCRALNKLLKSNKLTRITLSADFLRKIVQRQRLETVFIDSVNLCGQEYEFVLVRLSQLKFLLVRTTDRYLPEDIYHADDDN